MRFLVADDHPLVADALTQYLRTIDPAAEVIAATTIRGALSRLREGRKVALVLLDLDLPDAEGLQGLTQIREAFPQVPAVIVSGSRDLAALRRALDLGAAGVIPKTYSATAIVKALELILAGERHVPDSLLNAPGLGESGAAYRATGGTISQDRLAALSRYELAVWAELAKGLSNAEIGAALGITAAGAAYHLKGLYKKLNVETRGQAIALYHSP